jgi:hypothetical protein
MKKILSIPLIILLLFSGVTVNIATHFCNGAFIRNKISFSGELANCGMESDMNMDSHHANGINAHHTCLDVTSSYTLSSNYIPSSPDPDSGKLLMQIPVIPVSFILNELNLASCQDAFKVEPPGFHNPSSVDREVICIYRI